MGIYQPLGDFLSGFQDDSWDASFAEIERILRFKLPQSAHKHRAWWANQKRGNHSQAKSWMGAGWETRDIDQERERIRFERVGHIGDRVSSGSKVGADRDTWAEAARFTGITDRAELERAAIAALIQREAARTLALMGGTDPSAASAPRARPFE